MFYSVLVCSSFRLALLSLWFRCDAKPIYLSLSWHFVKGSKYLQSPASTGSSFHLSCVEDCDLFTPSHFYYKTPFYTSLTNSLCGTVTKLNGGANGCSSVTIWSYARLHLPCDICCSLHFICNTEKCSLHSEWDTELSFLRVKHISLRQTAHTKQKSSADPLLRYCMCIKPNYASYKCKGSLGILPRQHLPCFPDAVLCTAHSCGTSATHLSFGYGGHPLNMGSPDWLRLILVYCSNLPVQSAAQPVVTSLIYFVLGAEKGGWEKEFVNQ